MDHELSLTAQKVEELEQQAKDKGVHVDDLIREIVQIFLASAGKITRFAAKKGPRK